MCKYNPGGRAWRAAARLPAPRTGHGAASFYWTSEYAPPRWFILVVGGTTGENDNGGEEKENDTDYDNEGVHKPEKR